MLLVHSGGFLRWMRMTPVCILEWCRPTLSLIEQGYGVFVVTDASGTFKEHTSREAGNNRMGTSGCAATELDAARLAPGQ